MKTFLIFAFALVAFAHGLSLESNHAASPYKRLLRTRSTESCELGEEKMDDCNSCWCVGNEGNTGWACTRMECVKDEQGDEPQRDRRDADDEAASISCEPNSTFKMDCNTCFCSPEGKLGGCTLMFCFPETIQ